MRTADDQLRVMEDALPENKTPGIVHVVKSLSRSWCYYVIVIEIKYQMVAYCQHGTG